jgi:uncharacterized protein YjbI with pentapeptide repeats
MANPEHFAILKQGVDVWNQWREQNRHLIPNLKGIQLLGANLINANLMWANLFSANLRGVDLRKANLRSANLRGINLPGANLSGAYFIGADLSGTNLTDANLSSARLAGANLRGANLSGADLSGAVLGRTVFGGTDMSSTIGLICCEHLQPSVIDHETITRSGNLPRDFLRGCGLPDSLIEFLPSLLRAGDFYSCFISYSTKDQPFVDRLYADLQNKGVRCWFAPHDMQGGKKIHEQIDEAILRYDRLLVILSDHSMNSEWVKTEVANARQREILQKRQMLFPISLVPFEQIQHWTAFDPDAGKDSAREVREYFIPDFTNWKDHDLYQKEFERLLRDLHAEGRKPAMG